VRKVSDAADEILERIWTQLQGDRGERDLSQALDLRELAAPDQELRELVDAGLLRPGARQPEAGGEGAPLALTPSGLEAARDIVRRHRLAERLLADVLDVRGTQLNESACQFEHLLHPDIDEKVCILLGHPRTCPHGKPIPPGPCCQQGRVTKERIVSALVDMRHGERGTISYLHTHRHDILLKLMALGLLPGAPIELTRTFPSYVFRIGETEYAVDREIAAAVYVRLAD
jgi:DtxR family Mn-dependent transcriptional regulator